MPPKELLEEMYYRPMSFLEMGKELGVSNVTVKNWFKFYGIPIRSHKENQSLMMRKKRADLPDTLGEEYLAGASLNQLAQKYGVSAPPIRKKLKELGVKIRTAAEGGKLIVREKKFLPVSVIQQYYDGKSLNDLAKEHGTSRETVRQYLLRYSVDVRDRSAAAKNAVPKIMATNLDRYGYAFYPEVNRSAGEIEICDWLNSLGAFDFKPNRTSLQQGQELDCYDKNLKFAVEYCGNYWHSEAQKADKKYHYNKFIQCEQQGICLITLFEDEWDNRKPQVKNFIKAKLGVFDRRIYARKTIAKEIELGIARSFIEENHIQGKPQHISSAYGLFSDDELLGVISLGDHHRNGTETVLNRMCFKSGVQVVGGASKLFRHIRSIVWGPIKTWSDNRWTGGEVYARLGFKLLNNLKVSYSYTKGKERFPKQSMTKKNLGCPPEMTEAEWCFRHGFYRIWDCGKRSWISQ